VSPGAGADPSTAPRDTDEDARGDGDGDGDGDDRKRIERDLDTSLAVVAGAGTGKTTALVGRLLQIVEQGTPLRDVAAITFTEAAAAELRARIREALTDRPSNPRIDAALEEVDEAAICTLHAFAQRMLLEHGIAVGLPPGFEVLDEVADVAAFEDRWNRFADTLLDDPDAETPLSRAFALGLRPHDLQAVAFELHVNWDRLEEGALDHLGAIDDGPVDATTVVAALDRVLEATGWCTERSDFLFRHITGWLTSARGRLVAAAGDEQALLQVLRSPRKYSSTLGKKENWSERASDVRELCEHAEAARLAVLDATRASVVDSLLAHLVRFTMQAADERRDDGRITFHDLLVLARRLLRDDRAATDALRRRYTRILIDEFQDTDPIQVELAARLASSTPVAGNEADLSDVRPGALFVVGDPKQAIYRFRRADIELFARVRAHVGHEVKLHTNFRSVPGILAYVNAVFASLLGDGAPGQAEHVDLVAHRRPLGEEAPGRPEPAPIAPRPAQLAFDLNGHGNEHAGGESGPATGKVPLPGPSGPAPVLIVGGRLDMPAAEVRRTAGHDAAAALRHMVDSGWVVADPEDLTARPMRWGDIAVLIPTRASLPPLSEAFDELDVPYRLEGSALLWGSDEVRDILTVLRAADDPADAIAVVGALRSPGLACGDDDLVVWHRAGGIWDPRSSAPAGLEDHPVARAMAVVAELHRWRWWSEPSAMVSAALAASHAFELALAHRRPRDFWHRLRWLLDQARRFDETSAGTLRAFLHWAALQEAGDGRAGGVGPPDPDDDAVRVMTIHGAKGLEFPVVLVTGLERDGMGGHLPPKVVWAARPGHLEVSFGKDIATPGYADAAAHEKELDAMEQVRLLYVAMTRARDHLVLCLHHGSTRNGLSERSHGAQLGELGEQFPGLWRTMPMPRGAAGGHVATQGVRRPGTGADEPASVEEWEADTACWETERSARLVALRRRPVATATAIAERYAPRSAAGHAGTAGRSTRGLTPPDPGRPDAAEVPWRRGDDALLIGRAVHSALAAIDLDSGLDVAGRPADEVARQRARATGIESRADEVVAMVERALRSDAVRRAAGTRHYKELYVAMPLGEGEGVFEGFVDLVVDEPDGLVVVDYKTDRVSGVMAADVAGRHRLQVAAYANALEAATGRPVSRCVLVFVADDELAEDVLQGEELARARLDAAATALEVVASG
jgi:ATP-dependent exoDNAse (exonuclease V) beta subunit